MKVNPNNFEECKRLLKEAKFYCATMKAFGFEWTNARNAVRGVWNYDGTVVCRCGNWRARCDGDNLSLQFVKDM